MSVHNHVFSPHVELRVERCNRCSRWFGCEQFAQWLCVSCKVDDVTRLEAHIEKLMRSNASLRGALKRRASR